MFISYAPPTTAGLFWFYYSNLRAELVSVTMDTDEVTVTATQKLILKY